MPDGHIASRQEQIIAIVGKVLSFDDSTRELSEDQDLHNCGLTSINMVNLMLAIESEFDLTIPKKDLHPDNFKSLGAIDALIAKLVAYRDRPAILRE